jgi:hypothetical protein
MPSRAIARISIWALLCMVIVGGAGSLASCTWGRSPTAVSEATLRPTFTVAALSSPTPQPPATETVATPVETAVPTETVPTDEPPATASPVVVPPTDTPEPPASPTKSSGKPLNMWSPDYGMQAFLWWRAEVAQRDLELVREAGFRWVKQAFPWREIEGNGKGDFDWTITDRIVEQADAVGLRMIARLDTDPTWASGRHYPNDIEVIMSPPKDNKDFADFAYAIASRYKGRVAAYQIWNEPNLRREWGGRAPDPAGYVDLLKAGHQAIKRADPDAIVISAGLAPTTRWDNVAMPDTEFLKQMYAAGAKPYFDALGAHGAGYKAPPEMDPGDVANDPAYHNVGDANCPGPACRIYSFRHVEDMHQIMVDNGDTEKQVVVLEFGWTMDPRPDSPYAWHSVSEEQQADYFVRAYQYAKQHWQPWIGVMSLIYMPDVDWTEADEQYWWSIAVPNYPQFFPFKAYRDLRDMPK